MRGSNISIGEAVNDALDARDRRLSKALPGTVVTYNAATKTATVKPGVHRLVPSVSDPDDDEIEELPAIPDVPVCWPVGRGFAITPGIGLLPGDPVLLVCCDRDISGWLRTGTPSDPDDARLHSWGSAVAIPGLVHSAYANTPVDAAALASRLDTIFRAISALPDPTTLPTVLTAVIGIINAVKLSYPILAPSVPSVASCGSSILKVDA